MASDAGGEAALPESVYVLRDDASRDAITASLRALLRTRSHSIARHQFTVFDTFDHRVRQAGAQLTSSGTNGSATVAWRARGSQQPLTADLAQPLGFAWDLPKGPLQDEVAPVIGVRRLLPQADADEHGTLLDVLDDRHKTVARVRIESGQARLPVARAAWQAHPTILTLTALRGYETTYERLKPVIESRPGIATCPDGAESVILEHAGAAASRTLPSLDIELARDVRADAGARQIHRALIAILLANEPGVRADLDTEFLHDFRVALRRTRSLLRQLKHAFPADVVERFSTEFSWLGALTGPLRDLDVLALALRADPGDVADDEISAVLAFLEEGHATERRTLVEGLDSARYRALVTDWQRFLAASSSVADAGADAGRPLADVVSQRAWRLTKRIAKRARLVDENTDAATLHEIRIDAKKLRYLVDVTQTFYDADDLHVAVVALKKLQRVLGDFNDAQVQSAKLLECGRALGLGGGSASAVMALGQLSEARRQRGVNLRAQVADALTNFCAPATRSACRRAFKRDTIEGV